eukprot:4913240-Heterocapsa_arctica.AAC.1
MGCERPQTYLTAPGTTSGKRSPGGPKGWYQSIRRGSAAHLAATENPGAVGYSGPGDVGGFLDLVQSR